MCIDEYNTDHSGFELYLGVTLARKYNKICNVKSLGP